MKIVRSIGELKARIVTLEEDVAALKGELVTLRPPGVEFTAEAVFGIGVRVDHRPSISFDVDTGMEVWV